MHCFYQGRCYSRGVLAFMGLIEAFAKNITSPTCDLQLEQVFDYSGSYCEEGFMNYYFEYTRDFCTQDASKLQVKF